MRRLVGPLDSVTRSEQQSGDCGRCASVLLVIAVGFPRIVCRGFDRKNPILFVDTHFVAYAFQSARNGWQRVPDFTVSPRHGIKRVNAMQSVLSFFHLAPTISVFVAAAICLPSLLRGLGILRCRCGTLANASMAEASGPNRSKTHGALCQTQLLLLCFHLSCLLTVPLVCANFYLISGWPWGSAFHIAGWYLLLICLLYPLLWRWFLRNLFTRLTADGHGATGRAREKSPGQVVEFRRRIAIGAVSFAMVVLLSMLLI